MNENQNVFMDGKRTTSRVTNEPGGKSSVHLGWDSPKSERNCVFRSFWFCSSTLSHLFVSYLNLTLYHPLKPVAKEPKLKQTQKEKENVMQIVGSATASTKPNATAYSDKSRSAVVGSRGVSSNAYASGSSQNTGNVITDRPTSRVTQPPGGTSSISFCWSWRTKKNEEYELLWGIMPSIKFLKRLPSSYLAHAPSLSSFLVGRGESYIVCRFFLIEIEIERVWVVLSFSLAQDIPNKHWWALCLTFDQTLEKSSHIIIQLNLRLWLSCQQLYQTQAPT